MKAQRLEYRMCQFILAGFGRPDNEIIFPAVCVYVPEEEILVERDVNSVVLFGPPDYIYTAIIGKEARDSYEELLIETRATPQEIEVSEEFLEWAKAANRFRNPSSDICDLLQPKL